MPVQARFCEPTAEDWLERVDERFQTRPRIEARIARAPELAGEVYRARAGEEEETALVVLELANTLGRELWVNVLSVCEDRTHQLVTEGGTPILLGAQATRRVTIRLAHPAALELRRPLLDRYLVLASSRRYSLRDLERRDVPRGAGPDDEPGLPAIFEVAQHETITRGAAHAAVPIDPEDYGLRVLDVLVERAP